MFKKLDSTFFAQGDKILSSVILLLLAGSATVVCDEECPSCLRGNMTCYNATELFELDAPFRTRVVIPKMTILRPRNVLYYSFEPNINDPEYYKIAFVNLDNYTERGVISAGQKFNFGAFDIDQDKGIIYLGGSDGIYSLDTNTNTLVQFSSRGDHIVTIQFRDYVFFIRYGEWKIIRKKGDYFYPYLEVAHVKNFIISNDDVSVLQTPYGLYIFRGRDYYLLSSNAFFRGLTMDLDGVIYTWWIDGIYKVLVDPVLENSRLYKIFDISGVGHLTFDNDNSFIFTLDKIVFRLKQVNSTDC